MSFLKKKRKRNRYVILCIDVIMIIYEYLPSNEERYACRGISKIWRQAIRRLYPDHKIKEYLSDCGMTTKINKHDYTTDVVWIIINLMIGSEKHPTLSDYLVHNIIPISKERTIGLVDRKFKIKFLLVVLCGVIYKNQIMFVRKGDDHFNIIIG